MAVAAELTFLYGESVPRCTHRIDKHFIGYHTLQYMSAGAVELSVGSQGFRMEGRWFWSAYPGPRIAFHVAPPHRTWRHRYIAFRGPLVERWRGEGLFPIEPQPAPEDDDIGGQFDEMLRQSARTDRLSYLRAVHLLEGMLIRLAETRAHAETKPAWLRDATQRLAALATRGDEADYEAVAARLGMAESTLRRRFREATGMPPHEFVLQARVAEARRLLGETDRPIKSIAQELGYRDVYFFSRQFKKLAGVPPAMYRKSRQG
jgi:AraC-like DNA-binding protein